MRNGLQKFLSGLISICVFSLLLIAAAGCDPEGDSAPRIVGTAPHMTLRTAPVPQPNPAYKPPTKPAATTSRGKYAAWLPKVREQRGRWQGIIIHHSGVEYGDAAHEDKYHRSIGWDSLGYHFVINNGFYKNGYGKPDGLVEVGGRWKYQKTGSHCRISGDATNYYNEHTIGICLIGDLEKDRPTTKQWNSTVELVRFLQKRYGIPSNRIVGHGDIKPTKCPGRYMSVTKLRRAL